MGSKVERSEGRGKQRHGESVLDGNLRLRRSSGKNQDSSGSALLAVYERWWSEGGRGSGEVWRECGLGAADL